MTFAFGNAQHIGRRESQQDGFGFSDPANAPFVSHGGIVAVVADGMGGLEQGAQASSIAVRAFLDAYAQKTPDEPIGAALTRSLQAANLAVLQIGADCGTTLVAAVVDDQSLHWISVGDSALYLYREGDLALLNQSHVYANELDAQAQAGHITPEQAAAHPMREALTSYVGHAALPHVDSNIRPFHLDEDDCILLASDGLSKVLSEAEIAANMRGTFQERCEQLVSSVLGHNIPGQDNVTVVALGLKEPLPKAEFPPTSIVVPPPPPRRARRSYRGRLIVVAIGVVALAAGFFFHTPKRVALPSPAPGSERYDTSKLPAPLSPADEKPIPSEGQQK